MITKGNDQGRRARRARRKHVADKDPPCPFCGEVEPIYVDPGGGDSQVYTEDCAICCRPRVVHVEPGNVLGEVRVWLERGE